MFQKSLNTRSDINLLIPIASINEINGILITFASVLLYQGTCSSCESHYADHVGY